MNWTYFPRNQRITDQLKSVVEAFEEKSIDIASLRHKQQESNTVLSKMRNALVSRGFKVEKGKKSADKIQMPVSFKENGKMGVKFDVDAYCDASGIVLEIEAGRAWTNYQFLKDFFEACCMTDAQYLCLAVREEYRGHKDYEKICEFFDAMYISSRFQIPLKGILVVGY